MLINEKKNHLGKNSYFLKMFIMFIYILNQNQYSFDM